MKEKIFVLLFALFPILTLTTNFTKADSHDLPEFDFSRFDFFFDVDTSNPFYSAVRYLKFMQVVKGYEGNQFKPDNKISRAEFTKIIIASQFDKSEIDSCSDGQKFDDLAQDHWSLSYVCVATNHNIIQGYPDGTFKPEANINFAEAAKIINITFGYQTEPDPVWYKPYVVNFENNNVSPDTIETVDKEISRGEMAEMIFRIMQRVSNKPGTTFFVDKSAPMTPIESEDICTQNHFTMAFIVVTDPGTSLSSSREKLFNTFADTFEEAFFEATANLAVMNVTEVSTFPYEIDWLEPNVTDSVSLDTKKITKKFYETHGDDYDLLTIFQEYENPSAPAWHGEVKNIMKNIGIEIKDDTAEYGSKGRLLGVTGDMTLNTSDATSKKDYIIWELLHETGHQWCCGINDSNLKIADGAHFSLGLETSNGSVIDGIGGNVYYTFNEKTNEFLQMEDYYAETFRFHPFILYFMGLLPEDQYDVGYDVYDVGSYESQYAEAVKEANFFKNISVNDIIQTIGTRSCSE